MILAVHKDVPKWAATEAKATATRLLRDVGESITAVAWCEHLPRAWDHAPIGGVPQVCADTVIATAHELYGRRAMVLLNEDMKCKGRTFVYGLAYLPRMRNRRSATVSTARLQERWYGRAEDRERERARIRKVVRHELGHTLDLPHCESPRCLMNGVCQLHDLDELSGRFCKGCRAKMRGQATAARVAA